jgi:four helix bundle protein
MTDLLTSFRQLIVRQKSMHLAVRAYRTAKKRPSEDRVVLGYQIRKSSVSMSSNIAEGSAGIRHLTTSSIFGPLTAELETQLELVRSLERSAH